MTFILGRAAFAPGLFLSCAGKRPIRRKWCGSHQTGRNPKRSGRHAGIDAGVERRSLCGCSFQGGIAAPCKIANIAAIRALIFAANHTGLDFSETW